MVNVKVVEVKKDMDISYVTVLGLQIMKLVKMGYENFKILDEKDKVVIRAWRIRKKRGGVNE